MTIDIQCSCCGNHQKLSPEFDGFDVIVDETVKVIKRGWGSCGSALYCPECSKTWYERNGDRKMANDGNTFTVIMRLFFDAVNGTSCESERG